MLTATSGMISQFASIFGPLSALHDDRSTRQPLFLSAGIASVVLLWVLVTRRGAESHQDLSRLPGPKPLPLIGNLHQVNTAEPWLTYTAWRKIYGDLFHVRLLNQSFLILNSEKMARALLDQRSALYSDRPALVVYMNQVFGTDMATVMLPYGDMWRLHRKFFQHAFRAESEAHSREIYLRRVRTLLANLLDAPEEFERHLESYVAANVMALAYGYEAAPREDPMVRTAMTLMDILARALSPERGAILSAFPFLASLPEWFPGAGVSRDAVRTRRLTREVLDVPFEWVRKQMATGTAPPSLVVDCLAQLEQTDDQHQQEEAIKATAATVFLAGSETNSSTLLTFVLAMVLYPEVQGRAQAEIDKVLGRGRLPDFEDRAALPYVDALLRELVRWNPVVPLGVAHATSGNDVYDGCRIPKGTSVLVNVWAMSRDDRYAEAEAFVPERFLTEQGTLKDISTMSSDPVFGFGRRICPGRFASEASIWTAIVSILAAFRITKAKDAHGIEVDVQKRFTTGLVIRPVEFPCQIVPRFDERVQVIRQNA